MKDLTESQEVRETYVKIDLCYLEIEKAKAAYEKMFKNRSDIDKAIDKETGFHQKKAQQLARIMKTYLEQIIVYKKIIEADWGQDQKVVDGLKKILSNNPS